MQNNNPLTEISTMVLAALLIIAASLLMYFGKIDFTGATLMFGIAAGLYGGNLALKAPSSTQQTQLSNLQQGLQDLINLFASHTHPAPPTPPSTPTQPVQPAPVAAPATPPTPQFVPEPGVSMAAYQTGMMPAVQPPAVQP